MSYYKPVEEISNKNNWSIEESDYELENNLISFKSMVFDLKDEYIVKNIIIPILSNIPNKDTVIEEFNCTVEDIDDLRLSFDDLVLFISEISNDDLESVELDLVNLIEKTISDHLNLEEYEMNREENDTQVNVVDDVHDEYCGDKSINAFVDSICWIEFGGKPRNSIVRIPTIEFIKSILRKRNFDVDLIENCKVWCPIIGTNIWCLITPLNDSVYISFELIDITKELASVFENSMQFNIEFEYKGAHITAGLLDG